MKKPQTHHTLCTKKSLPASLATFQLLIHHTCKKLSSFVLSLRSNSYSFLQVLRISSFSLACLCCSSFHFCWAIQNVFSVSSTFCCSFSFNAIVYRKERKQVALQSMFKKKKNHIMIISSSVDCDILWDTGALTRPALDSNTFTTRKQSKLVLL